MMDFQLEGKVAIVTGASRGLGRATAKALVAEGAKVLAVARSEDDLRSLQAVAPERIKAQPCDMLDTVAVARLPEAAIDAFGGLDIVVNNAGIAPAGPFLEQDPAVWDSVMTVNVTAPAVLTRAAGQHLVAQGSGKIALLQFTKALAAEWGKTGVQVNAIAPGAFETDAQAAVLESADILKRRLGKIPVRRMGDVEEIGPLVCYLASAKSNFVTGSVFVIDGGESSKL
jgi:2-deoxy-D-gluconate 3-dehydrogenase